MRDVYILQSRETRGRAALRREPRIRKLSVGILAYNVESLRVQHLETGVRRQRQAAVTGKIFHLMHADIAQSFLLSGRLIIYDSVAKAIARSAADDRFDVLEHKLFAVYLVEIGHFPRIKPDIRGKHLFGTCAVFADNIYIERAARTGATLRDDLSNTGTTIKPYAPDLAGRRIIIDSAANGRKYDSFAEERSYGHSADVGYCVFPLDFRIVSELDVPVYSCRTRHVKPRRMRRKTGRRRKRLARRIFLKRHISGVSLSIYVSV